MSRAFGISEDDIQAITKVLKKYSDVEEAIIYGSRAMGNYRNGSDIDISLKGDKVTQETITKVSMELNEETRMPYHFDVTNYQTISNKDLIGHIDRLGKSFYKKP